MEAFNVIDTLSLARKTFPGASNNLDALCRRYNIDLTKREKHGALLDAELLADVFLEMNGGRQTGIDLEVEMKNRVERLSIEEKQLYSKKIISPDQKEEQKHQDILKVLGKHYW